jgi:hypothetical protein
MNAEFDISDISTLLHELAASGEITQSKADDLIWLAKIGIALLEIEFDELDAGHPSQASPSWHHYRPKPDVSQETPV